MNTMTLSSTGQLPLGLLMLEPSHDLYTKVGTGETTLSTVHSSSASLTVRDVKLFQTEIGETISATLFCIFVIFFISEAMWYLNM